MLVAPYVLVIVGIILLVLIVVIGVYPKPFFDRIRPAVAPIAAHLEAVRQTPARDLARGNLPVPTTTASIAQDRAR